MAAGPVSSGPRRGPTRTEHGAVLVVAVLLLVACLALGHGALLAARFQLRVAQAGAVQVGAREAAEAAARVGLGRGGGPWMDSVGVWGTGAALVGSFGPFRTEARFRRLSAESWLLEAEARPERGGAGHGVARLVWMLDPVERVARLPAVVGIGPDAPLDVEGVVDGTDVVDVDDAGAAEICGPWAEALLERFDGPSVPAVARLGADGLPPRLGRFDLEALLDVAEVALDGAGTPEPSERGGECLVGDPWNWGDPDRPGRPCGAHAPIRAARGDVLVDGGVGQALLIADGSVTLRGGARFHGLVLATGALRVIEGAEFRGYALAAGGLTVSPAARVVGSACWAARVLTANRRALGRAFEFSEPIGPL